MIKHRCFISYHHADQNEVSAFIDKFSTEEKVFTAYGLGRSMADEIINSTDTDYVMRRIRELYLKDSTVTLVMLGKCTWARRYVDWEIQASLRNGLTVTPNGLLGVKLPSFTAGTAFPERLNANLTSDADRVAGMEYRYAAHIPYPTSADGLASAIDAAHSRRITHAKNIVNKRDKFGYNRNCE